MATLDLIDVTKEHGTTTILNKINLNIQKGEFVVIVGPSGCGKSTLLRMIAGLEDISSGIIKINNHPVNKLPAAKRNMAFVFQNYALYPHMSVFNNMAYALKMKHFAKKDIISRVHEVAKVLKLIPYLDRKPHELSGGQKQRVAMGRAMVRSPAVFLFDEPLSNLDAKLKTQMRHEIKKLHQQFQTTNVYVTHDQTEAMTLAQKVVVLNQGKIEQIGTPLELYQKPQTLFVAEFTGHYSMNFIPAVFENNSIQSNLKVEYFAPKWAKLIEDKTRVILAIRPEHICVSEKYKKNAIAVKIEFIDDMGADKLLQVRFNQDISFNVRVSAEKIINSENIYIVLPPAKLHVFDQKSRQRIGDLGE